MKNELIRLISIICRSQDLISMKEIANKMEISPSKVKNLIRQANVFLDPKIARIEGKAGNGQGYHIDVYDPEKLERLLETEGWNNADADSREIRILNLLNILLSNEYVKAQDLQEQLFISKTQLNKDLRVIRELLEPYELNLKSVPYHGLSIEGNEFNKRLCLSNYLQRDIHFDWDQISLIDETIPKELKMTIRKILYHRLKEENFNVSENAFQSLVTHLCIMLLRVRKNLNIAPVYINRQEIETDDKLHELSRLILSDIEKEYDIRFTSGEEMYLLIHLAGKRYWENDENIVVSQEINNLINRLLEHIKEEYHVDFFNSFDLRIQLNLHMIPLQTRIRYNLNMINPLLNEIKARFVFEFDMALSCCRIIEKEYNCILSEDEASYIALYFGLEMDKNKIINKKKALLVCQSGKVSTMILKNQLLEKFSAYLDRIDSCLLIELQDIDLSEYQYIFSTIPISQRVQIPIINIQYFLTESEYHGIESILKNTTFAFDEFFDPDLFITGIKARDKETIIREMVETIRKKKNIPDDFYDMVIEREEISPTDFTYKTALPHPSRPIDLDTFVCIGILSKSVVWSSKRVQVVLLISVKKKSSGSIQDFYKKITGFISDKEKIDSLIEDPTFAHFKSLIQSE